MDSLVERLGALIDRQRRARGDYLYHGNADPEIVDARARIAEQDRLLKLAREAFKRIATVDENGLAEYTPQAMVAQANIALAAMEQADAE